MTHFKKAAIAAVLALGSVVSAQAATYTLGTLTSTETMLSATTSGSFTDLYTFSVGTSTSSAVGSFALLLNSVGTVISGITLTGSNGTSITSPAINYGNVLTTAGITSNLSQGVNYTLSVTGSGAGSYYTNIKLAAAVPEPETYAMLLAGLGMMGFIARRRQKRQG